MQMHGKQLNDCGRSRQRETFALNHGDAANHLDDRNNQGMPDEDCNEAGGE